MMHVQQFDRLWTRAEVETPASARGAAGELVNALANALDVEQVQFSQSDKAVLFLVDLGMLGFKRLDFNILVVAHPPHDTFEAEGLLGLLGTYSEFVKATDLSFLLLLTAKIGANPILDLLDSNVVPFAQDDLRRMLTEPSPHAVLFEMIQRRQTLEPHCPYNPWQIARGSMFQGRADELDAIISDDSTPLAITGARRIGKSSLLVKAMQRMRLRREYRDRVHSFVCLNWGRAQDGFQQIAEKLDPRSLPRIAEGGTHNFVSMLQRVSDDGRRPAHIFLDEADGLVDLDAAKRWPFFRAMLEATERRYVRMVVAGFRAMYLLAEGNSPFHRRLHTVTLEPLDESAARTLIVKPFVASGFHVVHRGKVGDQIWSYTGGFPYLIQYFGRLIFEVAVKRPGKEITVEDVEAVNAGEGFERFSYGHFLQNTVDRDGVPVRLERICVALLAAAPRGSSWNQETFLGHIFRVAHHRFANTPELRDQLDHALRNLCEAGILKTDDVGYRFALPVFARAISKQYPNPGQIID